MPEERLADVCSRQPSTPSDDCVLSATEREERERRMSTPEKQLYCWEYTMDAIQRGIEKGTTARKFRPVYSFQDCSSQPPADAKPPAAAPSVAVAVALAVAEPVPAVDSKADLVSAQVLASSAQVVAEPKASEPPGTPGTSSSARAKHQTWWWHKASGAAPEDAAAEETRQKARPTRQNAVATRSPRSYAPTNLERAVAKQLWEAQASRSASAGDAPVPTQQERATAALMKTTCFAVAAAAAAAGATATKASAGGQKDPEVTGGDEACVYTATAVTSEISADGTRKRAGAKDSKAAKIDSAKAKAVVR